MRNTYKKQGSTGFNSFGARKEFKNIPVGKVFNPTKKWFGTIQTSNGSWLVQYEGKFRSEAVAIFQEEARLVGGKLDKYIGAF